MVLIELLIDGLGRANPVEDAEACIYGYGAVRFLANAVVSSDTIGSFALNSSSVAKKTKTLAYRLIQHGANPLMILHLQMINEAVIFSTLFLHMNCVSLKSKKKKKIRTSLRALFSLSFQGAAAKLPSQTLHALYQLSSAFRVLSKIIMSDRELQLILSENNIKKPITVKSMPKSSESIDSVDFAIDPSNTFDGQITLAGPHLVRAAEICINQTEVQLSIIRTLSILSEHESCCGGIADMAPRLGILLGPILVDLPKYQKNNVPENVNVNSTSNKSLGMMNRIGYILGNVMANSDTARQQFYNNDAAMEYLLKCLEYHGNESIMFRRRARDLIANEMSSGDGDDANDCQIDTVTDVVIKLIRVIANLSVNAEVGYKLANHHQLGAILLTLLNTINKHHMNFVRKINLLCLPIECCPIAKLITMKSNSLSIWAGVYFFGN